MGRECSAKGILEQLRQEQKREGLKLSQEETNREGKGNVVTLHQELKQGQEHNQDQAKKQEMVDSLELLLKPEHGNDYLPYQLLKKKKQKKQSKGLHL